MPKASFGRKPPQQTIFQQTNEQKRNTIWGTLPAAILTQIQDRYQYLRDVVLSISNRIVQIKNYLYSVRCCFDGQEGTSKFCTVCKGLVSMEKDDMVGGVLTQKLCIALIT